MQLQPASGARDLNPQQVEKNHLIASKLSNIYRLWGYEQISPPNIERLETLTADGGISSDEILKVISDEPLGLRPELTTSIVRAASTRFSEKKRPLRFWALGTVFKCRRSLNGGIDIEENLNSGIELIGFNGIQAEIELLSILLESLKSIELAEDYEITLLIGHTSFLELITKDFKTSDKEKIKAILTNFDLINLEKLAIEDAQKEVLKKLIFTRGEPAKVIEVIKNNFGHKNSLKELEALFNIISPLAKSHNIKVQLDPTFETHYELYSGLIFQLVCNVSTAPIVIARGGRYDRLVQKFCKTSSYTYGVGFSYSIDKLREINNLLSMKSKKKQKVLVTYKNQENYEKAISRQRYWHSQGIISLISPCPTIYMKSAEELLEDFNCTDLDWIE